MSQTAQIELERIEKHYGAFHALKGISLSIPKGQFVALVGPSGCGKSTLLRSIAGLESITSGNISIAGQAMQGVPPRKRDVAMVFQSYALYPHMTVEQNLTYSLRWKKVPKSEAKQRARQVAETTGLGDLLGRYPRQLSGGQRQRVAMGRAIIRDPRAFLFDEPLSNLDASLRVKMRKEIRASHDRLHATSVYVTHDQIEAMTMADFVVVMRDGIIEQRGTPADLFDKPANRFVAGFIGSPAMNFVDAIVSEDGLSAALDLAAGGTVELPAKLQPGRQVVVGLRPEYLEIVDGQQSGHKIPVEVGIVESTGSTTYLTMNTTPEISVVANQRLGVRMGDTLELSISKDLVHVFDRDTGMTL